MESISVDTICWVILKAREVAVKDVAVLPEWGSNPSDDDMRDVLAADPDDQSEQELAGALDQLNFDQRSELLAIYMIGRGDFRAEDWPAVVALARAQVEAGLADFQRLTLLPDVLQQGLSMLGYDCSEMEAAHL